MAPVVSVSVPGLTEALPLMDGPSEQQQMPELLCHNALELRRNALAGTSSSPSSHSTAPHMGGPLHGYSEVNEMLG